MSASDEGSATPTEPALRLRPPGPDDLEPLLELMTEFNRLEQIPFERVSVTPSLRRLLQDDSLGFVLLAEWNGSGVGYGIVTFGYDLEWQGRDAFVTEVYLVAPMRGRGFGKQLMAGLEAHAVDHGVHALHLVVRHDNAEAIALYRRTGFATIPRQLMTKRLGRGGPEPLRPEGIGV